MTEPTGSQYDPNSPPAPPTGPMYSQPTGPVHGPQGQPMHSARQPPAKRPWFGPKRFGYGVGPQTWQGWLIMLAVPFVALAFVGAAVLVIRLATGH